MAHQQVFRELSLIIEDLVREKARVTIEAIRSRARELLSQVHDAESLIKAAWNYEEKHCVSYSLAEAVAWFKSHPMPQGVTGCILKERKGPDAPIDLHHCFLDAGQSPMLSGRHPHRLVKTWELALDLASKFGDKDLLVLK